MREVQMANSVTINADEGIHSSYIELLGDIYNRIPEESKNEKRLVELFAGRTFLYPKNDANPIGSANGRYVTADTKIVVSVETDTRLRQPGAIFYHEMGHLITHIMRMHPNGEPVGDFKKFKKKLKKECAAYVRIWEKEAKKRMKESIMEVSRKDRKAYLDSKIEELMKEDMLGYQSFTFAYDNLSDIVDGCTHDRFQLGCGHDPVDGVSYWDYPSHLPDEAFANIFRCKVLGLTQEYELIRRIFPKSCEIYEKIVRKTLKQTGKKLTGPGLVGLILLFTFCPLAAALITIYLQDNPVKKRLR